MTDPSRPPGPSFPRDVPISIVGLAGLWPVTAFFVSLYRIRKAAVEG